MVLLERWRQEVVETGRAVLTDGRPTIAMETYVRLMVLKARYRWGYRTLVAEVSDSIHLRRFCRIALGERVPDESTVRKLTRRIGAETVDELTRVVDREGDAGEAVPAAGGADRLDGDRGRRALPDRRGAGGARGAGARAGGPQAREAGRGAKRRVRDRSRAMGRKLRAMTRTIRRRTGEAKAEVLRLTGRPASCWSARSAEARTARGGCARRRARRARRERQAQRGGAAGAARGPLREGRRADPPARRGRADHRPARLARGPGRPADPQGQARQADRVRLRQPAREVTENTQPGARGLDPAGRDQAGQPGREHAAARHVAELTRLGIRPREIALDGGFNPGPTRQALDDHGLEPERVFIAGRQQPGSGRTQRRLQRYRTGAEGRISHLKRGYGLDRIPPQRRRRPADLDRLGDPRLQRRHARRPNPVKHSHAHSTRAPIHYERPREITPRPFRFRHHEFFRGK